MSYLGAVNFTVATSPTSTLTKEQALVVAREKARIALAAAAAKNAADAKAAGISVAEQLRKIGLNPATSGGLMDMKVAGIPVVALAGAALGLLVVAKKMGKL